MFQLDFLSVRKFDVSTVALTLAGNVLWLCEGAD